MSARRYASIDILRTIASVLIVSIHVATLNPQSIASEWIIPVARCAVPLFFMISGYFFSGFSQEKRKSQMKKMIWLVVLSNLLYFAYGFGMAFMYHDLTSYLANTFTLENGIHFIFFNVSPFRGHLWFLTALLYSMLFVPYLFKPKKRYFIIGTVTVLLVANQIFGNYSSAIWSQDIPNYFTRNFLFMGIPYFLIGYVMAKNNIQNCKLSRMGLAVGIIGFSLSTLAEKCILAHMGITLQGENYASTAFVSTGIFLLALQFTADPITGWCSRIAAIGRRYSLFIYIAHPVFVDIIKIIISKYSLPDNAFLWTALVWVVSLLCAVSFYWCKSKVKAGFHTGGRVKHYEMAVKTGPSVGAVTNTECLSGIILWKDDDYGCPSKSRDGKTDRNRDSQFGTQQHAGILCPVAKGCPCAGRGAAPRRRYRCGGRLDVAEPERCDGSAAQRPVPVSGPLRAGTNSGTGTAGVSGRIRRGRVPQLHQRGYPERRAL